MCNRWTSFFSFERLTSDSIDIFLLSRKLFYLRVPVGSNPDFGLGENNKMIESDICLSVEGCL
jgi:hypothetical protein